MPFVDLGTIAVTGTYLMFDETPARGTVIFDTPAALTALLDPAGNQIVVPKTIKVKLNTNGHFSVDLPATNDPDIGPTFTYQVTENIKGASGSRPRVYNITVPITSAGGTLDLADAVIVAPLGSTNIGALPPGGTTGQIPVKQSNADYDIGWVNSARLAIGSDPLEVAPQGSTGDNGSLNIGSRLGHVHPLPIGMGADFWYGAPPNHCTDALFDGVASVVGGATRSGSIYTLAGGASILARNGLNVTIEAGVTIKPQLGQGFVIAAADTLTIAGTIDLTGQSPAAGAAPTQPTFNGSGWAGQQGGIGGTGAGVAPIGTAFAPAGGMGGAGGASGSNAGGLRNGTFDTPSFLGGPLSYLYLLTQLAASGYAWFNLPLNPMGGGGGGGSGGGDGTNKGGSGGCGSGNLIILARKLVIASTAVIKTVGGNGAPGAGGNAAGGGGGGAGLIWVNTQSLTINGSPSISATNGTGGAGVGTGATGVNGIAISSFVDPTYGAGVALNVWQ